MKFANMQYDLCKRRKDGGQPSAKIGFGFGWRLIARKEKVSKYMYFTTVYTSHSRRKQKFGYQETEW